MGLTSPFLMCSSLQRTEDELWPSAELSQLGTYEIGPRFSCGCRLRGAGAGMGKTRFSLLPHCKCPATKAARRSSEGLLLQKFKRKNFSYYLSGYLRTLSFWNAVLGDCILLKGGHGQREIFTGLINVTFFVSHAPKGSGWFLVYFLQGQKKKTFINHLILVIWLICSQCLHSVFLRACHIWELCNAHGRSQSWPQLQGARKEKVKEEKGYLNKSSLIYCTSMLTLIQSILKTW